jgi:hypothetical protein
MFWVFDSMPGNICVVAFSQWRAIPRLIEIVVQDDRKGKSTLSLLYERRELKEECG